MRPRLSKAFQTMILEGSVPAWMYSKKKKAVKLEGIQISEANGKVFVKLTRGPDVVMEFDGFDADLRKGCIVNIVGLDIRCGLVIE